MLLTCRQVASPAHTRQAAHEWPLIWEIMLVCVLSVLTSSALMRLLDPRSHWVLRTHILTSLGVTAAFVVAFGCLLAMPPFARRR